MPCIARNKRAPGACRLKCLDVTVICQSCCHCAPSPSPWSATFPWRPRFQWPVWISAHTVALRCCSDRHAYATPDSGAPRHPARTLSWRRSIPSLPPLAAVQPPKSRQAHPEHSSCYTRRNNDTDNRVMHSAVHSYSDRAINTPPAGLAQNGVTPAPTSAP
jgi:hypothetical protein